MFLRLAILFLIFLLVLCQKALRFSKTFLQEIFFTSREDRIERMKISSYPSTPINKSKFLENFEKITPGLTLEEVYTYLQTEYTPYYKDKVIGTTSGTSGEMGIFVHDMESWIRTQAVLFSKLIYPSLWDLAPSLFNFKAIFIVATNGHFISRKLPEPVFKPFFVDSINLSMEDENLVQKINALSPAILFSYPSVLEKIYEELTINPTLIITGSEKLDIRKELSEKFPKSKIIETYGCGECAFIGNSCKFGNIHLNEDVCLVELVDEKKEIISEKNIPSSSIYITNLVNTYQPLIRYEIDDSLEYIDCFCGKEGAVTVHGKEVFYLYDIYGKGQKHTSLMLKLIFVSIPYPFSYQVIHSQQNNFLILLKTDESEVGNRVVENIKKYTNKYFLNLTYSIRFDLPFIQEKSGKIRSFISLKMNS